VEMPAGGKLTSLAAPFPSSLASAAADRRVNVWDLSKIGEEQTPGAFEAGRTLNHRVFAVACVCCS
jgi:hypothetical protein